MGYNAGETVIVTRDEVNHVGVVLDRYVVLKHVVYDVLLENRSAMVMINTAGKTTYINKLLTNKLCDTGAIESTIPYKQLVADDALPICRTYSAGKASW
jgi:ABC-type branched-subunit amino acid transport system ATPase component